MEPMALEHRIAKLESSNATMKRCFWVLGTLVAVFAFLGAQRADEKEDATRIVRGRELRLQDAAGHEYATIEVVAGSPQLRIKHRDGTKAVVGATAKTGSFVAQGLDKDQAEVLLAAAGENTQLSLKYGKAEYTIGAFGGKPFLVSNEGAAKK